ncbi:Extracellular exo-inulinase inuE [Penicillium chrysogenum]|uniref:Extracellular exo-inulinase inuE n=1 Tax=Penicillium chrysogenum TaxID=5076 RepID=A0A167T5W4_PENCH|nr:Extracellular exo-inulinase inuE [Penicillium chrysogenum]
MNAVHIIKALAVGILAGIANAFNYDQPYRGQYHFSPQENWINDPSGLLYHDGIYHLFFQYNPGGIEWGNLSWGHATSKDLTHWEEQPVALLARGYGGNVTEMYFTGSAVVDMKNTSGFGKNGKTPIVAMYTSFYPVTQTLPSGKAIQENQQAQSIAYSLDDDWNLASEFGPYNAQGGVWECPSIFQLPLDGGKSTKWILTAALNPSGPPGTVGSGNQYFGPDFYAAAGYNGLPIDTHVQIGWMNNWQYGANIPPSTWHGATTIPRHLTLKTIGDKRAAYSHKYNAVQEGSHYVGTTGETMKINLSFSAASKASKFAIAVRGSADFTEQTLVGYDFVKKQVFVDRTKSGDVSFDNTFASVYRGPLAAGVDGMVNLSIFVDRSSVEVFGGQGETTLTAQIFPRRDALNAKLLSTGGATESVKLDIFNVASTWK